MSIKLFLLKSGETVIADAKQLVSSTDEDGKQTIHGYILSNPHKVQVSKNNFVSSNDDEKEGREVQILMSAWILLTDDEDIQVPLDWVVTIVDPIESIVKMYQEKVNG